MINELVIFFYAEPKLINELVPLLTYEGAVPDEIQILSVTVGCFLSRLILSGICIVFVTSDKHMILIFLVVIFQIGLLYLLRIYYLVSVFVLSLSSCTMCEM